MVTKTKKEKMKEIISIIVTKIKRKTNRAKNTY